MPSYRLDVAYDGSGFRGYARQEGQRTVQGELESALGTVLGRPVDTSVAGRTDAGVHARGQVVSFVADEAFDLIRLERSINGLVGPEVAIMGVSEAADDFDARFSARWRRYRYVIDTRRAADPLERHFSWHVNRSLDLGAMRVAAAAFLGEHDFSAFCRSVEGKSNVRQVEESEWMEVASGLEYWVRAKAFCHQMVRSLVGYSYDVGRGFSDVTAVADVLEAKDRSAVATVAPPHGLTLWEVGF